MTEMLDLAGKINKIDTLNLYCVLRDGEEVWRC